MKASGDAELGRSERPSSSPLRPGGRTPRYGCHEGETRADAAVRFRATRTAASWFMGCTCGAALSMSLCRMSWAAEVQARPNPSVDQPPVTQYPSTYDASLVSEKAADPQPPASSAHVEAPTSARWAGFDTREGASLRSEDGRFSLRIGTLVQMRVITSDTPDPSRKFEVVPTLGRVYLQGKVGEPWVQYFLQTELAGQQNPFPEAPIAQAPRLLDVWIEMQPAAWLGLRLGMMRPAFTRSWVSGLQKMLMFDRAEANLFFRTHGPLPQASPAGTQPTVPWDRDIGAQLSGTLVEGRLEYVVGVFNGNGPLLGRNGDPNVMPRARIALNPLGAVTYDETVALSGSESPMRVQLGAAGYVNRYRVDYAGDGGSSAVGTEEQRTLGIDVTGYGHGLYVSSEGYIRQRKGYDGSRHRERGVTALAGWMFASPHWELAGRASFIDPHVGQDNDTRKIYDAAINYYHWGNNLKVELRYSYAKNELAFPGGGTPSAPFTVPANQVVQSVSLLSQLYF